MGIIYSPRALMGTMSLGQLPQRKMGASPRPDCRLLLLTFGNLLLALIVIIACLKTAIGLISAFGDTLHGLFPRLSYVA